MDTEKRVIWANVIRTGLELVAYGTGRALIAAALVGAAEIFSGGFESINLNSLIAAGIVGLLWSLPFYVDTVAARPIFNSNNS